MAKDGNKKRSAGGRSSKDGIRFFIDKYYIQLTSVNETTAKVNLYEKMEPKERKIVDKIPDVPFLRSIKILWNNLDTWCIVVFGMVLAEIISKIRVARFTGSMPEANLTQTILSILLTIVIPLALIFIGNGAKLNMLNFKRLTKFHGAEHKVIMNFETEDEMTYENCCKARRISNNCGTMVVTIYWFITAIIDIIFCIAPVPTWITTLSWTRLLITMIIAIEIFANGRNSKILKPVFAAGYFLQEKVFTREPDEYQLRQALETFKILIAAEDGKLSEEDLEQLYSKKGKEIKIDKN